jgi:hypothetical protein
VDLIKDTLRALALGFILSLMVYFAFAQTGSWTEPTASPPGGNVLAPLTLDAQGNLAIPGSINIGQGLTVGSGNVNLPANLDIGGTFKFKLSGFDIIPQLFNGGEDSYSWTGYVWYTNTDTCDGNVNSSYGCGVDEKRGCWDLYDVCVCCPSCGYRGSQSINCNIGVRLTAP